MTTRESRCWFSRSKVKINFEDSTYKKLIIIIIHVLPRILHLILKSIGIGRGVVKN